MALSILMLSKNILQHYQGYEGLLKKLDEAIQRYQRHSINIAIGFLNPDESAVAEKYLSDTIPYQLYGGYDQALRKMLIIGQVSDWMEYFVCLKARFNGKFHHITHQDVKGALFHLGLEMDRFGDFWVDGQNIYIYVASQLQDDVCLSFDKIASCNVAFEVCDYQEQIFQFEQRKIHVSSLRLDKITSAIIGKSREKASKMITSSLVNVNYKTIEESAFLCNNYDILSLRGFGRYQITEIIQNNRSGNYVVTVEKFV